MHTTKMMLAVLAVAVWTAPARAATTPTYVVRDALGSIVGPVVGDASGLPGLSDDSLLWVSRPVAGTPLRLLVGENGPWDTKGLAPLLYESNDCSGTPLMETPATPTDARGALVFDTYVYWPEGPGAPHTIRSQATFVSTPDDCTAKIVAPRVCCSALGSASTRASAPVVSLPLANLQLSPPFRVDPTPAN